MVDKLTSDNNIANPLHRIVPPLLAWYDENSRALPWRKDTDPYRVWISEIMLQQTQVETVIPYYERFLRQVPNIKALAEIDEQKLLKLWEGLGYYSRARNLKKAAQMIMSVHNGHFPQNFVDILALPGIGNYTAGAIVSICFEQPVPAVDGNVLRVVSRLTGSEDDIAMPEVKRKITEMLREIYPTKRCGDFTQSLMELGATVCIPKGTPDCVNCPAAQFCIAYQKNIQQQLPVKTKKKPRKKEEKTVFLLCCEDKMAVQQRETGALLGGLWQFPNVQGNLLPQQAEQTLNQWGIEVESIKKGRRKKHVFTHIEWDMTSYIVSCNNMPELFLWVTQEELNNDIALPGAFQPFLDKT